GGDGATHVALLPGNVDPGLRDAQPGACGPGRRDLETSQRIAGAPGRAYVMGFFLGGLLARLRANRALYALTLLGVALGVASVLSIQILNHSALGAFQGSVRAVGGEADLTVSPRGPFLPEEFFPRILGQAGGASAWPVIRTQVALAGRTPMFLELVGLDLFAPRRLPWKRSPGEFSQALSLPGWAAVTPALAKRMGWKI